MRHLAGYGLLILGRVISAGSGYVVLAYSANLLDPVSFSELSFYQALQFLAIIGLDSGTIQSAMRRVAGDPEWQSLARNYQGIRTGAHGISALLIVIAATFGFVHPGDELLPFACALALLSNTLNADWLLIALNWQKVWATKTIIVGLTNVLSTVILFHIFSRSSVVFMALLIANTVGATYLYRQGLTLASKPRLPDAEQLRDSLAQSVASIATHTAYNLPLLSATSLAPGEIGGGFACVYRIFSASTLFVPLMTDFSVARMIAMSKSSTKGTPPMWRLSLIFATCGTAVLPFLLVPSQIIFDGVAVTIQLRKFGLSVEDFLFYKIALILYCLEYGSQRISYAMNNNRAMVFSAMAGLIACTAVIYFLSKDQPREGTWWFLPLYTFQLIVMAILVPVSYITHTRRK